MVRLSEVRWFAPIGPERCMSKAFHNLVDQFYENLYRYAFSLSRSRETAWDLTQETFLIWARKRSTIRVRGATKSWLYTTLYREYLKVARQRQRLQPMDDQYIACTADEDAVAPERALEASEVVAALQELREGYRQVVTLYYLESYSYREIAEILDIPIGTVMSRLARGKEKLRDSLSNGRDGDSKIVGFDAREKESSNG